MTSTGRIHNLFQNAPGDRHVLFDMMHDAAHHASEYTPAPQPFHPPRRRKRDHGRSAPELRKPKNVFFGMYNGATLPQRGKVRVVDRNTYVDTELRRKYVPHRAPSLYHEPRMNRGHIYERGVQDLSFRGPSAIYKDIDTESTTAKQIPQLHMLTQYANRRESKQVQAKRRNRHNVSRHR